MAKVKTGKKGLFGKTIITPVGRLVFPSIAKPKPFQEGQAKKYSCHLVVNQSPKLDELINEIIKLRTEYFKSDSSDIYLPFEKGEDVLKKIAEPSDQTVVLYSDRVRLIAKGSEDKEPPKCYLADKSQMPRRSGSEEDLKRIDETFYPGAFVRLAVTPFTFVTGKNKGIGLILKGVQFYKDGDRLGGVDIDKAFDEGFSDDGDWESSSPDPWDSQNGQPVDTGVAEDDLPY